MLKQKLCKNGHPIGTVADCKCCRISNYTKSKWRNRTPAMEAALIARCANGNVDGLNSNEAIRKRAVYFQSDEHKAKASAQSKKLAADRRAGIKPPAIITKCNTKPELAVRAVLESINCAFIQQGTVGPYAFDFLLPNYKLLIEVQGEYWHNQPHNINNDLTKASYVRNQHPDYEIIYIQEIETKTIGTVEAIILLKIGKAPVTLPKTIDLRRLAVRSIDRDAAINLLAGCHYLPRLRKTTRATHGVFHDDRLIGAAIYGLPTYYWTSAQYGLQPKNVLELMRFALLPGCNVKNLFSWTLGRSVKLLKQSHPSVALLVSFADPHFGHSGTAYKASGWEDVGLTKPSYYYIDANGGMIHKRTLWDHAQKMHTSEIDYATSHGFSRINTPPKHKFILWLDRSLQHNQTKCGNNVLQIKCNGCSEAFVVSDKAYKAAIKKRGRYICHTCSVQEVWNSSSYRESRKHLDYSDKETMIVASCACGNQATVKIKSLRKAEQKHGEYVCHVCTVKRAWKRRKSISHITQFIDVVCGCGMKSTIKIKSLKKAEQKHGMYMCHLCATKKAANGICKPMTPVTVREARSGHSFDSGATI